MADVNVLVVFYSRYGRAEQLALAAGVGAIQAEANIRLRRVADDVDRAVIEADAAWSAALTRMNRDYVPPRPADPVWADAIVLATPAVSAGELAAYVASLPALGPMAGKLAAPLAPPVAGDETASVDAICVAAARAGLIVVTGSSLDGEGDAAARARALGQRVTHMARMLKPLPPRS
jgi:hypothetical protein